MTPKNPLQWSTLCHNTLSHSQHSLSHHRNVSKTYYNYITEFLTLRQMDAVARERNCRNVASSADQTGAEKQGSQSHNRPTSSSSDALHMGLCGYAACPNTVKLDPSHAATLLSLALQGNQKDTEEDKDRKQALKASQKVAGAASKKRPVVFVGGRRIIPEGEPAPAKQQQQQQQGSSPSNNDNNKESSSATTSTSHSNDVSTFTFMPKSDSKSYLPPLYFCSQECKKAFVSRRSQLASKDPVSFRPGIIKLVSKSHPDISVNDLARMREKAIGKWRGERVVKKDLQQKTDVSVKQKQPLDKSAHHKILETESNVSTIAADEKSPVTSSNAHSSTHKSTTNKTTSLPYHPKISAFRHTATKKITPPTTPDPDSEDGITPDESISLKSKDSVPAPPQQFEAVSGAKEGQNVVTIEGFVLPTALEEEPGSKVTILPTPASQNSEPEKEDTDSQQHEDQDAEQPFAPEFNPDLVLEPKEAKTESETQTTKKTSHKTVDKMEARQIFFGFSSDDEVSEDDESDVKSYMSESRNSFSTYQRLFLTVSRWITSDSVQFLHRFDPNQDNRRVSRTTSGVTAPRNKDQLQLENLRQVYQDMNINLDAPRSQDGPTTKEMKKPTRKRRRPKPDVPQKKSTTSGRTQEEQTASKEENDTTSQVPSQEQLVEQKRFSTHVALNDPNYQRFQVSLESLKSSLPAVVKTLNLKYTSQESLSRQLDAYMRTMDHFDAAECSNSKEWEILCLALLFTLYSNRALRLDERDVESVEKDAVVSKVGKLGMDSHHFETLVESMSKGF